MNMKICLLSASTKNIDWEDYGHPDWFDVTRANHQAYADKWGWDYVSLTVSNSNVGDRHPTWLKVRELRRALSIARREGNWDWIVWIDADAGFTNLDIDFTQFLEMAESEHDVVLPKEQPDPKTGQCWTRINTGLMAIRCNSYSEALLDRMWEYPGEFRYDHFHEQSWLDNWFKGDMSRCENLFDKHTEDLNTPVSLGKLLVIPYKLHLLHIQDNMPFVYHAAGSTPTKTERLKRVLCI